MFESPAFSIMTLMAHKNRLNLDERKLTDEEFKYAKTVCESELTVVPGLDLTELHEAIVAAKEMLSAIMNIRETFEDAARLSAITNIRETFEDAGRQCAETTPDDLVWLRDAQLKAKATGPAYTQGLKDILEKALTTPAEQVRPEGSNSDDSVLPIRSPIF